ncbi:hypothetical protein CC86DRAFT_284453 [Ophiobolus disseminans]|uniref:Xylanolytic transcriptional activator regulatory domain-containing protein n=1 Tax=Ophiobolus disseminans TaxID=1469910 RepID=A0A6A7ABM5_9PLEO|nr:hypothetical protein CC86DRAFT_284453 [Ophiobolus disseminans]
MRPESSYDIDFLPEDPTQVLDTHNTGYLGHICEVVWLRNLKSRVQPLANLPPSTVFTQLGETNFYQDHCGVRMVEQQNPFNLPPEITATLLFQCYYQTVQVTFPIIPTDISHQLHLYYDSVRSGEPVTYPQRWFAIVHLVLAIGTRFSRLINAPWHGDHDENVYLSSARQFLDLEDSAIMLAKPDLPLIQAFGLLAFYYMSIGHVNRAWVTVGTAMRFAIALGFHTQAQILSGNLQQALVVTQTWWSLHHLESLLSSMTGRPCILRSDDITTPLPSDMEDDPRKTISTVALPILFPDAQVRLAVITQEVLSTLYTRRRTPRSWAQAHAIIMSMNSELDEWALDAMPPNPEGSYTIPDLDGQQRMLRKQYYRLRILITRPSLRRIERCFETGSSEFTAFDQDVAETCIQTAQDVASLLPDDVNLDLVYHKGPWWTIMHNIMQSLTILLIGISCRPHFLSSYAGSVVSAKKLITWLGYMRETNDTAKRAYQIVHSIVVANNMADPFVWTDVAGVFGNEHIEGQRQMDPPVYLPWAGGEQALQEQDDYRDGGEYGYFGVDVA